MMSLLYVMRMLVKRVDSGEGGVECYQGRAL